MTVEIPTMPGLPPEFVFDPRAGENDLGQLGPAISARFFIGPDPRTDSVDQQVVDAEGRIPDIELVEIINRNDPKNSPMICISTDHHRYKMYPREYKAFRSGIAMEATGTPIKDWLGDNSRTQNLAYYHIHTVEQMAAVSDSLCQTLGPGTYDLKRRAEAFLKVRQDSTFTERLASENSVLRTRLDALQAQIDQFGTLVNANQARTIPAQESTHPAEEEYREESVMPRRRGRPPKPAMQQMREALRAQDAEIERSTHGDE